MRPASATVVGPLRPPLTGPRAGRPGRPVRFAPGLQVWAQSLRGVRPVVAALLSATRAWDFPTQSMGSLSGTPANILIRGFRKQPTSCPHKMILWGIHLTLG